MRNLWFDEDMKEAIDSHRIHHQLLPMKMEFESGFPEVHISKYCIGLVVIKFYYFVEYSEQFKAEGSQYVHV